MQYFPSLLHTMVHRMHFFGILPVTPQFLIRINPRQKDRIFRKTETSDFPRQNIRTFAPKTRHFAAKKSEVFHPPPKNRLTAATPRTTYSKKHTKASPTETLHTTNLTPRPPKPHLTTLKTIQNTPRKRHLPTQSENISKIIPKTFGRYTHTTYLCITQRNKDRFFSSAENI